MTSTARQRPSAAELFHLRDEGASTRAHTSVVKSFGKHIRDANANALAMGLASFPGCNSTLTLAGGRSLGCLGTTTGYHLASLRDASHFCALPGTDVEWAIQIRTLPFFGAALLGGVELILLWSKEVDVEGTVRVVIESMEQGISVKS